MCCKNSDNQNRVNGSAKKKEAVKDLILFFGALVKASVEGVVEFWGKGTAEAQPSAEPVYGTDVGADDRLYVEIEELPVYEEPACAPTSRELKAQMKTLRREEKLARKEEKRELKAAKKEAKLLKKQENRLKKEEKKQRNCEKKLEKQEKKEPKDVQRVRYIAKNRILSKTEKKFLDAIRSAVGLGYVVKTRVAMTKVVRHADGTKCKGEDLGEMDFGVFDLRNRLKVMVEVKGMKRQNQQSQREYREVERLCREASIPVIFFKAKHAKRTKYIKRRMRDFLNIR